MRISFLLLAGIAVAVSFLAAQPPEARPGTGDKLQILNEGGVNVDLPGGTIVFHDAVKVFESDLYMECELLTLRQLTNQSANAPAMVTSTNLGVRPDLIIAETNLMMMARGTTVIGDRAVYTTSNGTVVVTGDLVVIERSNIVLFSTNFIYNSLTSTGMIVGWSATEIEVGSGFSGTNALRPGFGPAPRAPKSPRNGKAK